MDDPHTPQKKDINDCSLPSCFNDNSAHLSTELKPQSNKPKNQTKPREKALKPTLKDLTQQFSPWDLSHAPPNSNNSCFSQMEWSPTQAQASGILCPALIPKFCHTLRALFLFSPGHQVSVGQRAPKPNLNTLSPQTPKPMGRFRAPSSKCFCFCFLPLPTSPEHCTISDLWCQDPVLLHLYKYRRKAPRHCQDVCIIQVRGSRENKRGRSIRNAANSWHESRTPAIQKLAHFNNFTSIKCPFNPFDPCSSISQNTQAEEILTLSIFPPFPFALQCCSPHTSPSPGHINQLSLLRSTQGLCP